MLLYAIFMNQSERIEAMERLPKHIGEAVIVIYIDQMSQQSSMRGILKEVTPYQNIVVNHLMRVPDWMQEEFRGRKITKGMTGIPFLGSPDAIVSILTRKGEVLYDNENVHPRYNPYYFPHLDERGKLRIGISHEAGEAFTQCTREISFGRQHREYPLE